MLSAEGALADPARLLPAPGPGNVPLLVKPGAVGVLPPGVVLVPPPEADPNPGRVGAVAVVVGVPGPPVFPSPGPPPAEPKPGRDGLLDAGAAGGGGLGSVSLPEAEPAEELLEGEPLAGVDGGAEVGGADAAAPSCDPPLEATCVGAWLVQPMVTVAKPAPHTRSHALNFMGIPELSF